MWGTMTASVFLPCHGKTAHAPRRNRAGGPACRALDQWFSTPGSVPQGLRFFKRCTVINSFIKLGQRFSLENKMGYSSIIYQMKN